MTVAQAYNLKAIGIQGKSVTAGGQQAIFTPAAGKCFRLLGFVVATVVACTLNIREGASLSAFIIEVPLLIAGSPVVIGAEDLGDGFITKRPGEAINIQPSAETVVQGTIWGHEE